MTYVSPIVRAVFSVKPDGDDSYKPFLKSSLQKESHSVIMAMLGSLSGDPLLLTGTRRHALNLGFHEQN